MTSAPQTQALRDRPSRMTTSFYGIVANATTANSHRVHCCVSIGHFSLWVHRPPGRERTNAGHSGLEPAQPLQGSLWDEVGKTPLAERVARPSLHVAAHAATVKLASGGHHTPCKVRQETGKTGKRPQHSRGGNKNPAISHPMPWPALAGGTPSPVPHPVSPSRASCP